MMTVAFDPIAHAGAVAGVQIHGQAASFFTATAGGRSAGHVNSVSPCRIRLKVSELA